jgi:non-ribosomal peptide synthetase component F
LSHHAHVTPFMLLLTVFEALLQRYTGQTDLVIGLPVANRRWPEVEGLIGYFVNVLVLRIDLAGDPSFRELLRRVRDVVLNAHAHQDLPFAQLVEALRPERDMSYNPLFQVMFSWTPALKTPQLPELDTAFTELETGIYQSADLALDFEETVQGLTGGVSYNTDLFDDTTIARIITDYAALLDRITASEADLDQPLSDWLQFILIPGRRSNAMARSDDVSTSADAVAQRKLKLANRRANLPDAKRALLEKRRRGEES